MDMSYLKKSRTTDFAKIAQELEKVANPTSNNNQEDNRFWKLEKDKAGNGSAVIRFLPKIETDELPWIKSYSHGFQGPTGRWYIEDSLSTIGEEDGVSVMNRELWNSGVDANKEQARKQKRRLAYVSNILVVSDPKNPDNNGKVFLFRYGKKIFDKIMDAARPTFEDEKPMNAFDYLEGANFKLRIRVVDDYPNYDQSVFEGPSEIGDGDEKELVRIMSAAHSLADLIDPKKFKTRAELDKKLAWVMDAKPASTRNVEEALALNVTKEEPVKSKVAPETKPKASAPEKTSEVKTDDLDSFFDSFDLDS